MGLFDILKKQNTVSIENISIQRMIPKMKEWKNDTIIISTSRQYSDCKKYNQKIYSVFGWNKKYPKLPDCLKVNKCPECNTSVGATMYYEGISTKQK